MAKMRTDVAAALPLLLLCFADGAAGDEAALEGGTDAASVLLTAGSWAPLTRVAEGARASFRFRPEASEGASGGALRALLIDATGDARVGALYALTLPGGGGGGRAALLRCHRIHWAPPPRHAPLRHAPAPAPVAVAPAPAGRVATIYGLPGAPVRHCSVAMYFTLQVPAAAADRERSVALHAAGGLVRVWAEGALYQWRDPQPFAPAYLQVGVADMAARLHIDEAQQQQPHYANGNDIWCVLPRICKCTPGYHGDFCTALCPVGSWGEDCAQSCGACLEEDGEDGEDACDPATGACPLGCRPGFLPPLCTEEVVRLTDAPTVRVLNTSALEVTADARCVTGKGTPRYALVQYRPTDGFQADAAWAALAPVALVVENEAVAPARGAEVRGVVAGLRAGTAYAVRVLLLTEDGAWSPRAPIARNSTACAVPDSFEYKVYAYVDPKYNSTIIRWMATGSGATRCRVRAWRLRLRAPSASWEREVDRREPLRGAQLDVPPAPAQLTVQALTPSGPLLPSRPVPVLAGAPELGRVLDLKVEELEPRSVTLTWYPPACCPDLPLSYIITIECERLVHCAAEPCAQPRRTLRVEAGEEPRAMLRGLRPDARYRVALAAEMEGCSRPGPKARLVFDTKSAAPEMRLEPSLVEVRRLGSESFELQWAFPANCSSANGALQGVHYSLRPAAGGAAAFGGLASGRRQPFRNLRPATEYLVTLRLVTSQDSPAPETTIRVTTLPEGAEEVRVHEAARERVGLRWLPPEGSAFRGVAVTTRAEGAPRNESHPAWSEPCARWPSMRCLTLADLLPDTRYHIWVHITTLNNSIIQEQTFYLVTRTTEGTPSAPRELRAEAASSTQLRLRWRAPAQRGGVLRNFVLIVHHVRAFARGTCCERNHITSVVVPPADADRQDHFEHEVTDLPPASSFRVSLSAVTATAGPAASLIAHTAPLLPLAAAPDDPAAPATPAMKLLSGPHPCLRVRLPPAAATAFSSSDIAPVRRLFTFLTPPEDEWTSWRRVTKATTTPTPTNDSAQATTNVTLPEALLRVLPEGYKNLQEVYEAEGAWACVAGAAGGGERAGAALLLQYEGAASAAAWRSDPFDLLRCFPTPAAPDSYACL